MSRLISKINKMPVRSPSPDIANRNSIVRTSSPINDALTKSRLNRSSKSPLGKAFLDNQQYQTYIKELQQQNNLLSKQNIFLRDENQKHCKENTFLKEMNLKQRRQISRKSQSQLIYQPNIISQYDTRILQLSKQCKRIQDLYSNERSKILLLEQQLKQKEERDTHNSEKNVYNPYQQLRRKKEFSDIETSLNQSFNQLFQEYIISIKDELKSKDNQITKLQHQQNYLINLIQTKNKHKSPIQSKPQYSSNKNTLNQDRTHDSSIKHIQCQYCKQYLLRIKQLQAQIQIQHFTTASPKKATSQYLQKLTQIKTVLQNQQIELSINQIENNLNDIYAIDQKFQYLISQKNSLIQQLRQKETQQAIDLIALKKENGILKVQLSGHLLQIQQLKKLLKNESNSLRSSEMVQIIPKRSSPIGEGDILRKYIEQAISRIQNLETEIINNTKQ